jgi:hypothetical protein
MEVRRYVGRKGNREARKSENIISHVLPESDHDREIAVPLIETTYLSSRVSGFDNLLYILTAESEPSELLAVRPNLYEGKSRHLLHLYIGAAGN